MPSFSRSSGAMGGKSDKCCPRQWVAPSGGREWCSLWVDMSISSESAGGGQRRKIGPAASEVISVHILAWNEPRTLGAAESEDAGSLVLG